ncbi:MAG: PepSY-associated TM helix domain-containing protein [Vicinamibacterales bacterium]
MNDSRERLVGLPESVLRAPARMRRAIYQLHLWTGLVLGLYLAMLSVTGSALVYRLELNRLFQAPAPAFDPDRVPMASDALAEAARRAYPGYDVSTMGTRISRNRPVVEVRLARGDDHLDRLFNPYTGADLGDAMSPVMRALTWLARLHDDLLLGETGRRLNGIGSALVGLVVVTGVITWWPTGARRRRSGRARPSVTRSTNATVHRLLGIWGGGLMLVWVVSGIYLAFPEPFDMAASVVSGDDLTGIGYQVLTWLTYLHFGRFSAAVQIVWLVVGLLPVVLVVTGVGMWWTRKVRRSVVRTPAGAARQWAGPLWTARATSVALVVVGCGAWALYTWSNYREERQVERFLGVVASGQYRRAHAMWDGDGYGFERFLADWGPGGRYTAAGSDIQVIDSTTQGAAVTVYIKTAAPTPVALDVDKETMLLSQGLSDDYAADAVTP